MDLADRALLEGTVRDAIAEATRRGTDVAVDEALAQLGWLEMLESEPRDAIDIVFTALGAANATATVLDDVVAAALGAKPRPEVAVLLSPFARWDQPGRLEGDTMTAAGLATRRVASASDLLVACGHQSEVRCATVGTSAADITPVRGVDPDLGLHAVLVSRPAGDTESLDAGAWDAAVAAGRRAIAHEIEGACRTMLDLARTHAMERVQFGRPVVRFQAVRHRLSEAFVAVEALAATTAAAWDEPGPTTAALAKAVAGRTARTVGAHCQQVLAGVGFTLDHPFHRYLKRTMVLDGLLGSADEISIDLGHQLLTNRKVPTLVEL